MVQRLAQYLGDAATPYHSITKSDTIGFSDSHICTAIYVGTTGDVAAVSAIDDAVYLHKNVPSGSYIFGRFKRVNSTNTTAADMLAVR